MKDLEDLDDDIGNGPECEGCGKTPVSAEVGGRLLCADCIKKLGTGDDD